MNRWSIPIVAALTLTISAWTTHAQPAAHQTPNVALTQAIQKALPQGATEVAQPLPVELGPLGRVQVVLYRRNDADTLFRGIALISSADTYRAVPLPTEVDSAGNYEEITTAILGADIAKTDPDTSVPGGAKQGLTQTLPSETAQPRTKRTESGQRALVILYYAHQFGQTTSNAFGRVYLYDAGAFRIDEVRTHLLDGVRTAAVARQRLAPNP